MACVRHLGSKIGAISSPERRQAACAGWAAPRRRHALTCQPCWRSRAFPVMASEGVPPQRGWARWRSDACPAMAYEGGAGDPVPTRTAVGCVPGDGARGRSQRWPVQAMDAFPAMARACPIRTRWRSGCSHHGVESGADFHTNRPLVPAQRLAHQPRRHDRLGWRACHTSTFQNRHDLVAGTASGCMRWLGGTTPEGRADLPDVLTPEGGA